MGCQYEIADQILKQEGQYIFSLKGNQGNLFDDVKTYLEDTHIFTNLASHQDVDKGHGRIETRTCWVSHDIAWLHERHPRWKSINSLIRIVAVRDIKGKVSCETRYYISSLQGMPVKILMAIRNHWAIENTLHWVLYQIP